MVTIRNLRPDEVEVRVGSCFQNGANFLLYKDSRCDMNILDETFGIFGWKREHVILNGKEYCIVSVWDSEKQQWVSKMDTGTESAVEKEKGQSSDAFKRACVNIGIGRELYTSPNIFINVPTEQKGNGYTLSRPYPSFKVVTMDIENKKIVKLEIANKSTGEIVYTYPRKTAEKPKQTTYKLPTCEMCGNAIVPMGGFTTDNIINITKKNTGKQLCVDCYRKVKGQSNG